MTEIVNQAVPGEWRETPLTLADRCSRKGCNAAALVRTFHNQCTPPITDTAIVDLVWCAHDYVHFAAALAPVTLHVQDERQALVDSEKARLGKDVNYA